MEIGNDNEIKIIQHAEVFTNPLRDIEPVKIESK